MFRLAQQMIKNKMVGATLLIIFLSVLAFSLFHMPTAGMGMSEAASDCLFMTHEVTLCSMGVLDHVAAWQSAFLATIPSFALLLLLLVAALVLFTVAPNLLVKQKYRAPLLSRNLTERTSLFIARPLQELFSNGILHPKLF